MLYNLWFRHLWLDFTEELWLTYGIYHQVFLECLMLSISQQKKKVSLEKINKNFTCITYMLLCSMKIRMWPFQLKTYLFSYQFFLWILSSIIFFFILLLLMVMFSVWFDVSCFWFYINRRLFVCMTIRHSWEKEKKRPKEKRRHWRRAEREEQGGSQKWIMN